MTTEDWYTSMLSSSWLLQRVRSGSTERGWVSFIRMAGRERREASRRGKITRRGETQHFSRIGMTAVLRP